VVEGNGGLLRPGLMWEAAGAPAALAA
jgi:hypothetical protein